MVALIAVFHWKKYQQNIKRHLHSSNKGSRQAGSVKLLGNSSGSGPLDLYIAGTIFAMELGECNANITFLHKRNRVCSFILLPLF